jgi:hypothetical protein
MTPEAQAATKEQYLRKAIDEYEYSPAPEYDKSSMSSKALTEGHLILITTRRSRRWNSALTAHG